MRDEIKIKKMIGVLEGWLKEENKKEDEEELKSKIYEVVRRLTKEEKAIGGYFGVIGKIGVWQIKSELPDIDENTIKKLLRELVYCDEKLCEVEREYTYCEPSYFTLK